MSKIKTAVITGGHSFDLPNFTKLFDKMETVDPYIQHWEDFCSSTQETRDGYDALLFYIMMMDKGGPPADGLPWYAGNPREVLGALGESGQGIVILHHAILSYPNWDVWTGLTGLEPDRSFDYHIGLELNVNVVDKSHPITEGIDDFDMYDETYQMPDTDADSEILLSLDHEKSMKHIAWTRDFRNSRIFNFQSGHDNSTWLNANFQTVLERGIKWTAKVI
ncbi:MAG: ThuA domain-containing protein [Lentisphaeria bacterium]|nr:ThuA domain-containing protein [Lentisphaeria bacterium]